MWSDKAISICLFLCSEDVERPLTAESCPTCGHNRPSGGGGLGGGGGSNAGSSSILHVSYVNSTEVPKGGNAAAPKFEKSPKSPTGAAVMAARSSQVRGREGESGFGCWSDLCVGFIG